MKQLILASKSPRRQELLKLTGYPFTICESNAEELTYTGGKVCDYVMKNARRKALKVQKNFPDGIILGADTVVAYQNRILGKPKDEQDAFHMLKALSGNIHEVYTGLCIADGNTILSDYERSLVKFRTLDEDEITNYINTGEPLDKAGAYGIQGLAAVFVKEIKGDFYNIVGLPVCKVNELLKERYHV